MTTWALNQVRQVESFYMRVVVDSSRHPDELAHVRQAATAKMAQAFVRSAHAFAVEVNESDLVVEWETSDTDPCSEVGVIRWRPGTTEVEMRGGQADGRRIQIQRVGEPIKVAANSQPAWMGTEVDHSATRASLSPSITYALAGWIEEERVWVYELNQ